MRSMYASVSGLKVHQTMMDVIGDNIANVNTIGYKGSRTTFKQMLSQTLKGASSPDQQAGKGGINPQQIGLGVSLGSIDIDMSSGNLQSTGKKSDAAIQGDGFFVLNSGEEGNLYSRAGSFSFDKTGHLYSTSNGHRIQGWIADEKGEFNDISPDSLKDIILDQTMDAEATEKINYNGNLNPTFSELKLTSESDVFEISNGGTDTDNINVDLSKNGSNQWQFTLSASDTDTVFKDANGIDIGDTLTGTINLKSDGTVVSIVDEDGNVFVEDGTNNGITVADVAGTGNSTTISLPDFEEHINNTALFTGDNSGDIVDANTNNVKTITTDIFDSQGAKHKVSLTAEKIENNIWQIAQDGVSVTGAEQPAGGWLGGADHQIVFKADGSISSGQTASLIFNPEAGAADGQKVSLDFSSLTQFDGEMTADFDTIDGHGQGTLQSFAIDDTGTITGSFDNGETRPLAKLALANFSNPAGLERTGGLFQVSSNSGTPRIGEAGTGGRGELAPASIEMSNVDLAEQFTEMITAQRGFQASSKLISTSDEMMQQLVNLKR